MCSADQAEGEGPAIMAPAGYSVGCKRLIAVVLFDADHDAAVEERAPKRAQTGDIVPYVAPQPDRVESTEAVTLAALLVAANVPMASDRAMALYVAPQPDRVEPTKAVTLAALPPVADVPVASDTAMVLYVAPQPDRVEPTEAVTLAALPSAVDVPVASDTAMVLYVAPQPDRVEPTEAVMLAALPPAADVPVASDTAMVLYVAPQPDRVKPTETVTLAALPPTADVPVASDTAMVLYVAPSAPIDARPINAVPFATAAPGPERRRKAEMPTDDKREAPSWMRKILLSRLELRFDLSVHFITEKTVTKTDLDPHQNRFRLPTDAVQRHLLPILTADEATSANLLQDIPRRVRARWEPENIDGKQGQPKTRRKKKGKKHGGLDVTLVHLTAGMKKLQLSRWESSHGTIIKGDGYIEFIKSCGFLEGDTVQIWAFKEREFRHFGAIFTKASPLYIVLVGAPRPPVESAAPAPAPTAEQPDKQ
ncbi:hypothetical protein ABZP36_016008 [Zizania latifolia]